jgi:hypothetical protein
MGYDPQKLAALAAAPDAAVNVFAYLQDGLNREVGNGLMTASVYDLDRMRSRRVFSEDLEAYPVGNFKRLDQNRYFDTVIAANKPFSSTTIEEIAEVFFDWEKIQALGFESNMNLPAVADGRVIGTVNLLAAKGHYTPARVVHALEWQPVATLAFLLLRLGDIEQATFLPEFTALTPRMEGA